MCSNNNQIPSWLEDLANKNQADAAIKQSHFLLMQNDLKNKDDYSIHLDGRLLRIDFDAFQHGPHYVKNKIVNQNIE